jgi:hypothetical protein
MLRRYLSPVCSKLDYVSFVHGSATITKLSITDLVHNTGIRVSTGAFRSSRPNSLGGMWRTTSFCGGTFSYAVML